MRTPIERLAYLIETECDPAMKLGAMAKRYDESVERVQDAIDVGKIVRGQATTLPPVPWHPGGPGRVGPPG